MVDLSDGILRDSAGWIIRPDPTTRPRLTGDEAFAGVGGATVSDFWRFAMQDLQMNNTRGYLAEFLVGRALSIESNRVEWDPFDLLWHPNSTDSVRIEVKSSAYLQSWRQRQLSKPSFSGLKGRVLNEETGEYSFRADYNADVYVMCLNGQMDPEAFDPLDINQWKFYVVPRHRLAAYSFASVDLRWLERESISSVDYSSLRDQIGKAWYVERRITRRPVIPAEKIAIRENAEFNVPIEFSQLDDRPAAPCTSCGASTIYDAAELHVIRSAHGSSSTGHFDTYCSSHLADWIDTHR